MTFALDCHVVDSNKVDTIKLLSANKIETLFIIQHFSNLPKKNIMTYNELTPSFVIYINGARLPAEAEADIKEIRITLNIDSPSVFQIKMSDPNIKWTDSKALTIGDEVKILIGYKDDIEEVIDGEITAIEDSYKRRLGHTVTFKGYDRMHRLTRGRKVSANKDVSYSDIIRKIANKAQLKAEVEEIGSMKPFILQDSQKDYHFILGIADRHNSHFWVKDKTLHFKKIDPNTKGDIILEFGKTLFEIDNRLTSVRLVSDVEVRGWDENEGKEIFNTATANDILLRIGGDIAGNTIVKKYIGKPAEEILIDSRYNDQKSAEQAGIDFLTRNSMEYIHAAGVTQGNYDIKAGDIIEIKELGKRFSGDYHLASVRHILIPMQGYTTEFMGKRNMVGDVSDMPAGRIEHEQYNAGNPPGIKERA